jgi:hypothetical protein
MAEALYFLDKYEEAAKTILEPTLLPFVRRGQVQLLLAVTRGFANTNPTTSVPASLFETIVNVASEWFHDDEIAAQALGVLHTVHGENLSEGQITKTQNFSERYFRERPDDLAFQRVSISDDLSELFEMLKSQHEPVEQAMTDLMNQVALGVAPYAIAAEASRRCYAESLVKQMLYCDVALGYPDDRTAGVEAVGRALSDDATVVDTSALVVGPKTGSPRSNTIAYFARVLLPYSLRNDVRQGASSLAMRSTGTMGWDSRAQRPVLTEYDAETVERYATEAMALQNDLDRLTLVPDSTEPNAQLWNAALLVAKESGLTLWADDLALRAYARNVGVPAFGTLDLLQVADPDFDAETVFSALAKERVVDLALPDNWADAGEAFGWGDTDFLSISIGRPFAWRELGSAFNGYMQMIRNLPTIADPNSVARWAARASTGVAWRTPVPGRAAAVGALLAWTALNSDPVFEHTRMRTGPTDASDLSAIPNAGRFLQTLMHVGDELQKHLFEHGDALGRMVASLTHALRAGMDQPTAARFMANVISTLDHEYRGRVLEAFLNTPPLGDIEGGQL